MIQTAALLWFAKDLVYPSAEIAKAARYDRLWLLGHNDLRGSAGPDHASIDATIAQIRAVKPDAWIGLYVGGVMFKREIDPPSLWLTDADLLHRPDGSPLVLHDTTGVWSGGDVFTYCAPNLTSQAVVDKLVQGYVAFVQAHHLDGILLDGFDPDFYATLVRGAPADGSGMFGAMTGCLEGPMHQTDAWVGPLAALGDQLRWYLGPLGVEFVFNGIHPGFDNATKLPHADGAMMEAIGQAYGSVSQFTGIIEVVNDAVALGRSVDMSAMPWTTKPTGLRAQRLYLGLHLLCAAPGVSFGYSPYVPYRAWDGEEPHGHPSGNPAVFWSSDWEIDYGHPLAPATQLPPIGGAPTTAWARWYQSPSGQCLVLVNPSDNYQLGVTGPGVFENPWHEVGEPSVLDQGPQAPLWRIWLPPHSARVLFRVVA